MAKSHRSSLFALSSCTQFVWENREMLLLLFVVCHWVSSQQAISFNIVGGNFEMLPHCCCCRMDFALECTGKGVNSSWIGQQAHLMETNWTDFHFYFFFYLDCNCNWIQWEEMSCMQLDGCLPLSRCIWFAKCNKCNKSSDCLYMPKALQIPIGLQQFTLRAHEHDRGHIFILSDDQKYTDTRSAFKFKPTELLARLQKAT